MAVGTAEFGEGTPTAHIQIAATQPGTPPSRIRLVQSDADRTGFDTGAFAGAGLFVSGNAVPAGRQRRALTMPTTRTGCSGGGCGPSRTSRRVGPT